MSMFEAGRIEGVTAGIAILKIRILVRQDQHDGDVCGFSETQ